MRTTINAEPAEWSPAIQELWDNLLYIPEGQLITSNWFTARPYVDEYNRGSRHEGFVFTVLQDGVHQVFQNQWDVGKPAETYIEPRRRT